MFGRIYNLSINQASFVPNVVANRQTQESYPHQEIPCRIKTLETVVLSFKGPRFSAIV